MYKNCKIKNCEFYIKNKECFAYIQTCSTIICNNKKCNLYNINYKYNCKRNYKIN